MAILIGHASIDENNKASGGVAGDQTGKEVCTRTWYSKPWDFLLRCKDTAKAEKMALACEQGCANNKIGYDQGQRNTLYTQAKAVGYDLSKITTACECDCSSFMAVCAIAAGIKITYGTNAPTTSTMKNVFGATGEFDIITEPKYLSGDSYLKRGDILVKAGSHTIMALQDGSAVSAVPAGISVGASKLKAASTVKAVQTWLNTYYNTGLTVDGIYGAKTKAAIIKAWQAEVGGLAVDGIFGAKSKAAASSHNIKKGSAGILVTIWQAYLVCRGYNPNGIDGQFGAGCHTTTVSFQKANGLTQDGIVGSNTWTKAFG